VDQVDAAKPAESAGRRNESSRIVPRLAAPERAREDSIADVIGEGIALAFGFAGPWSPEVERTMADVLRRGEAIHSEGAAR
jgi:hypothetical protein